MTDSIKYSLIALGLIILLFLYNSSSQKSLEMDGQAIFNGSKEEVYRIRLSENDKEIELTKTDTTWSFSNNDSLVVKENQVDKIFKRLLKVEKEILITSKEEKWEKFGVDDSRIAQVVGMADRDPIEPNDPMAPANRRISIVLLSQSKADNPGQQPTDETKIATETSLPKVKLEKETAEKNNRTQAVN